MMHRRQLSLSKKLTSISATAILPMIILSSYLLWALSDATNAYSDINRNISYANEYVQNFKERIDYTMYLSVIGNKKIKELGVGKTTVNGIVTVNPYSYMRELNSACSSLSETATVSSNTNQMKRTKNTLNALRKSIEKLQKNINEGAPYDENMDILDQDIYVLTSLVQSGLQNYIYTETTNFENVKANLDKKNKQMVTTCLVTLLLVSLITASLTTNAVKSVTNPIRKLCDQTSKVAKGDFTANTKVESINEIAILTRNFNDMTQEIGLLVEDIKKNQENLHLIEMKLLQAQINPHFLYNTLDTIVWLAEMKKNDEVVAIVTYLSSFFRTTLSKGKDFITIQEEELHVESYMNIQKFRYQDVMDFEIHIDKELYPYTIPKLMLQPLAENALVHGVRNKRGKSHISITGRKDGENIIFQVIDDGRGMDKEELLKLRQCIAHNNNNATDNGGFGIVNVNQRIKSYYGDDYGISYESELGKGTAATITIAAKNIQPFS
ncbi:sensor histidine kinase [bacterium 1xD8-6]|jgi:Predicted signal transduction protein with a C-terminal ATPase domain|nr:sensor histidine kinase [Lachnospiraceae bacterium]RKI24917.1 sensor histidine kinase [bacterium D16-36]RKI66793.1 sensor histidine kinase [bacterium 1xD8-6]